MCPCVTVFLFFQSITYFCYGNNVITSSTTVSETDFSRTSKRTSFSRPTIRTTTVAFSYFDSFTKSHLRFCPFTPLCYQDFRTTTPSYSYDFKVPCCRQCSCTSDCLEYGTCCPDFLGYLPTKADLESVRFQCRRAQYREYAETKINAKAFWMISTCSSNWTNDAIAERCRTLNSPVNISQIAPVSDKQSKSLYKNMFCALCNFVSEDNVAIWEPSLDCKESWFLPTSYEKLWTEIYDTEDCNVRFSSPPGFSYDACEKYIDKCNQTGEWDVYNELWERACHAYTSTYYDERQYYQNVFCYLCNTRQGVEPETYCELFSPPITIRFSVLLDFTSQGHHEENGEMVDDTCIDDQVFDPYKSVCHDIQCQEGAVLKNRKCIQIYKANTDEDMRICLRVHMKFTPKVQLPAEKSYLVALDIKNFLFQLLLDLRLLPYVAKLDLHFVSNSEWASESFYLSSLEIVVDGYLNEKDIINSMLEVDGRILPTYFTNISLLITLETEHFRSLFERQITEEFPTQIDADPALRVYCLPVLPLLVINRMLDCPLIDIGKAGYNVTFNGSDVFVEELNKVLSSNKFMPSNNYIPDSSIVICSEDFISLFLGLQLPETQKPKKVGQGSTKDKGGTVQGILGLCCTTVSVFCLLITLMTYVIHPSLRTQPGKNNMALCIAMVCSQLLFQFGIGQTHIPKIWCRVIGILVHFSNLHTVLWMNVCCVHMYRVFTSMKKMDSEPKGLKTTVFYALYCAVIAAVPVIVNITVSVVTSDDLGYGKALCYISSSLMIGLTFALPVGVVIIFNIGLFFIVVCHIARTKSVNSTTTRTRNYLAVYLRLSTVTGLTWMFGFLYAFTNLAAFEFCFIIFNAGQGVFIMLAFVLNRRVRKMYRDRFFPRQETSSGLTMSTSVHPKETVTLHVYSNRY